MFLSEDIVKMKSLPSLNNKANRGYHKTSSEDDKAPRGGGGRGNFHLKKTGCSHLLVVKKVVLVFLMVLSLIKCTAGAFAPGTL